MKIFKHIWQVILRKCVFLRSETAHLQHKISYLSPTQIQKVIHYTHDQGWGFFQFRDNLYAYDKDKRQYIGEIGSIVWILKHGHTLYFGNPYHLTSQRFVEYVYHNIAQ